MSTFATGLAVSLAKYSPETADLFLTALAEADEPTFERVRECARHTDTIGMLKALGLPLCKCCECGQLIAKLRAEGLELKCKRCKHFTVIPFTSIEGWTPAPPESSPISR